MKKGLIAIAIIGLAFGETKVEERQVVSMVKYDVPSNIKLTVGNVRCTAAGCQQSGANVSPGLFQLLQLAGVPNFEGIGNGLRDMFNTALNQTGCFKIFDREALEAIRQELALAGKTMKAESADYIVLANVTSINFERKGGNLGLGIIPILSAISVTKQTAQLAMDVRLVKVETGEVVFTKTYTAEAGKTSYGFGGAGYASGVGFGGTLSGLSGTAMEEVARDIIMRASFDIAKFLVPDRVKEVKVEVPKKEAQKQESSE